MRAEIGKYSTALSLLLVLAVMVMIFCFSAENAEKSGKTSGKIVDAILMLCCPEYQELSFQRQSRLRGNLSFAVRKTAHFTEFALLGFSLMLHISLLQKKRPLRYAPWWAAGIGALYAASDEAHQFFVGGRAPSFMDVGIDSLGVLFGLGLLLLVKRIPRNNKRL